MDICKQRQQHDFLRPDPSIRRCAWIDGYQTTGRRRRAIALQARDGVALARRFQAPEQQRQQGVNPRGKPGIAPFLGMSGVMEAASSIEKYACRDLVGIVSTPDSGPFVDRFLPVRLAILSRVSPLTAPANLAAPVTFFPRPLAGPAAACRAFASALSIGSMVSIVSEWIPAKRDHSPR
jgi:hypothetical protein